MGMVNKKDNQQIRALLNSLELAAYGDNCSKHHQYPDVQLFQHYAQQLFELSHNIEIHFPNEGTKQSSLNLMFDVERDIMHKLSAFDVKKNMPNHEICNVLVPFLTQIQSTFESLINDTEVRPIDGEKINSH